jgi:hypothetical protein
MKRVVSRLILGLAVLAMLGRSFADDSPGPSKEETNAFLERKAFFRCGGFVETIDFENDVLVSRDELTTADGRTGEVSTWIRVHRVELSALNPSSVKVAIIDDEWGASFGFPFDDVTTDKIRKVHVEATEHGRVVLRSDEYTIRVYASDRASAQQVAKALRHLIRLSGGKHELFENDD